jgi:isoleucyl-tRNA synthetase
VKFELQNEPGTYILAWTTTPWTLPGNVGLAVGEKIQYVKVKSGNNLLILAKERLNVLGEGVEIVEELKGKDLLGQEYKPLYPFLKEQLPESEKAKVENAYKIYAADFVTTEDGTGVVHTAVMYGQDDFVLGTKVHLPKYHLVQEDGHFK